VRKRRRKKKTKDDSKFYYFKKRASKFSYMTNGCHRTTNVSSDVRLKYVATNDESY
jgi:hypothetical protein